MNFVPFDADAEEERAWRVLRTGIPSGMRRPLLGWLWDRLLYARRSSLDVGQMLDIENALDVHFGITPDYTGYIQEDSFLRIVGRLEDRLILRIVDYALYKGSRHSSDSVKLQALLDSGRSAYYVADRDGHNRIGQRVPEGVQDAAESVTQSEGAPGMLLRRAWGKVYDLEADASGAYSDAVKAVESAAIAALGLDVTPSTNLSTAVRVIEKRDASWRLPFTREHTEYPSKDLLLGLLKSLYRGQSDRHGREAYADVSHAEAEAAVLLAVTLVGWFERGLIAERSGDEFV